jgi:hypothetical protein
MERRGGGRKSRENPGDTCEGDEVAWTEVAERGNAVGTLRGTSVRETKSRGREFPSVGMLSEHSGGQA